MFQLKSGDPVSTVVSNGGPSIVLCLGNAQYSIDNGPNEVLQTGKVLFVRADQTLNLYPDPSQPTESQVFVAQCNF